LTSQREKESEREGKGGFAWALFFSSHQDYQKQEETDGTENLAISGKKSEEAGGVPGENRSKKKL